MKKHYKLYFKYFDPIKGRNINELIYEFDKESDYDFAFFKITAPYCAYIDNNYMKDNNRLHNYTEVHRGEANELYANTIEYKYTGRSDYFVKMAELHLKLLKDIFGTMHNQKSFEEVFISLGGLDRINDTISSFKNPDYPYRSRTHGYELAEYRIPYYDEDKDEYDYIEFRIKYNKYLISNR